MGFEPFKTQFIGIFDMFLPFPVSNNALHAPSNSGGIHLTAKARGYYAMMHNTLANEDYETMKGRLKVELWVYEPDLRKRDINNLTKSLFDALERCKVYENDHQIDETHIYRMECIKGGQVRVRITKIKDDDERITLKEIENIDKKEKRKEQRNEELNKIVKKSRFNRSK